MRLYLAHPIVDREWVRKVELQLEKELNIELVNPFYDAGERKDIVDIDAGRQSVYGRELNAKKIVTGDLKAIDRSNGIVAVISPSRTVGTIMEIMYAWRKSESLLSRLKRFLLRRKSLVFIVCTDEKVNEHPWLRYLSQNKIFNTFENWKTYMKEEVL